MAFAEAAARKTPPEPFPSLPASMVPLWGIYITLTRRRSYGFEAPNPITYGEVEAFCRLTRTTLSAWEVDVLMHLDDATLKGWAADRADREPEQQSRPAPKPSDPYDIPATNKPMVSAFFHDLAIKQAARLARKNKEEPE